jgi:hypothetical protein
MIRLILLLVISGVCSAAYAVDRIVIAIDGPDGKPYPTKSVCIWVPQSNVSFDMIEIRPGRWYSDDIPSGATQVNFDIERVGDHSAIRFRKAKRSPLIEVKLTNKDVKILDTRFPGVPTRGTSIPAGCGGQTGTPQALPQDPYDGQQPIPPP